LTRNEGRSRGRESDEREEEKGGHAAGENECWRKGRGFSLAVKEEKSATASSGLNSFHRGVLSSPRNSRVMIRHTMEKTQER